MGGLNPLDQIQPWVIVAIIVIYALTLLALRRVFFLPLIEVMERRELELEAAEATIAEAERVIAETEPEALRIVAEAHEKADGLRQRSREKAETYRRETVDAAMHASAAALEKGRASIAAERKAEVAQMRDQAVECVTLACDKLVGAADPRTVTASVDKLLARKVH